MVPNRFSVSKVQNRTMYLKYRTAQNIVYIYLKQFSLIYLYINAELAIIVQTSTVCILLVETSRTIGKFRLKGMKIKSISKQRH